MQSVSFTKKRRERLVRLEAEGSPRLHRKGLALCPWDPAGFVWWLSPCSKRFTGHRSTEV